MAIADLGNPYYQILLDFKHLHLYCSVFAPSEVANIVQKVIDLEDQIYGVLALIAVHLVCLSSHDCVIYCLYSHITVLRPYHTLDCTIEQSWHDQYGIVTGDPYLSDVHTLYGHTCI